MQKNWQGRLRLLAKMTIEVPKAPSCETPQVLRGWGLGRDCTPSPVDKGAWGSVTSPPAESGGSPRSLWIFYVSSFILFLKFKFNSQFYIIPGTDESI